LGSPNGFFTTVVLDDWAATKHIVEFSSRVVAEVASATVGAAEAAKAMAPTVQHWW
jgi:hypothetical protein